MFNFLPSILLLLIINSSVTSAQQLPNNYICTNAFCEKYLETTGCDTSGVSCRTQNALTGIVLPSQTACSCCESCLEYLGDGDDCTIGLIGAPVPTAVCGPDLTCITRNDEEHATCQYRTDTMCLAGVTTFNSSITEGTLGHLMIKPDCDTLGEYQAFRCIPGQICYCVNRDGQRIFGESLYTTNMALRMRCECSRNEVFSRQVLGLSSSNSFIKCDERGSYVPIQCLGSKCSCVDPHRGIPTSPLYNRTNLADLQRDWKCFDGNPEILERPCEQARNTLSEYALSYLTFTELGNMCQPDGYFNRVQRNETHFYCADKFGEPIEDFGQLVDAVEKINCNCARVMDLLKRNNRIEFPQCCPNGNFKRINCRRGYCYCVNSNGHQTTREVPREHKSKLTCTVDELEEEESECN